MPTDTTDATSEPRSINAPPKSHGGISARDAKAAHTHPGPGLTSSDGRRTTRRRLLIGVLGLLVLAAVLWFGIPWVRLTLNTVSTDDAFVNGHATFVAARVRGQVAR